MIGEIQGDIPVDVNKAYDTQKKEKLKEKLKSKSGTYTME